MAVLFGYVRHPRPHPERPGADWQRTPVPKPSTRTGGIRVPIGPAPIGNRARCQQIGAYRRTRVYSSVTTSPSV